MIDNMSLSRSFYNQVEQSVRGWVEDAIYNLRSMSGDLDALANRLVFYTSTMPGKMETRYMTGTLPSRLKEDCFGERGKVSLDGWTTIDAARILLLKECVSDRKCSLDEFFQLCYRYSDDGERVSLLKALSIIPVGQNSVDFVVDVARTNSLWVFSALAINNPWPASYFSLDAFNQLVLKSIFMGLDISRIIGLRASLNGELGRMAADFVQERIDAGREVPESIWLVVDFSRLKNAGVESWRNFMNAGGASRQRLIQMCLEWHSVRIGGVLDEVGELAVAK